MHNINRRNFLKTSLGAAGLASFAGAQLLAGPALAQVTDTLRIGLSTYPPNFRPWLDVGYSTQLVVALINRALMSYTPAGELQGELVEQWAMENDKLWSFRLREAKFNDGTPVTSDDVKWTLEEIMKPENGAYIPSAFPNIDQVEVVDDRHFRIHTSITDVTLPSALATPFFTIIKKGSTDEVEQGIGAGPYRMVYAEKGIGITLERSDHYFKSGLPQIKSVQITPYPDENLRVAALKVGDVDVIDYVPWHAMDDINADDNLILDSVPAGAFMSLSFNGGGVLGDVRLRQAICFGIKRDEIVKGVFFGHGSELRGVPRARETPYWHEETANYWSYDPERARQLVVDAGYGDGVEVSLLSTAQYTMHRDTAVLIQGHLAEIGIKVNLMLPDWASRIAMGNRGVGDFSVQGGGLHTLDPDAPTPTIDPTQPPSYSGSYNIEAADLVELMQRGRQETDLQKRIEIYKQIDMLVYEKATFCGVAYRATGFARATRVKGIEMLPGQISPFTGTLFDRLTLA